MIYLIENYLIFINFVVGNRDNDDEHRRQI